MILQSLLSLSLVSLVGCEELDSFWLEEEEEDVSVSNSSSVLFTEDQAE